MFWYNTKTKCVIFRLSKFLFQINLFECYMVIRRMVIGGINGVSFFFLNPILTGNLQCHSRYKRTMSIYCLEILIDCLARGRWTGVCQTRLTKTIRCPLQPYAGGAWYARIHRPPGRQKNHAALCEVKKICLTSRNSRWNMYSLLIISRQFLSTWNISFSLRFGRRSIFILVQYRVNYSTGRGWQNPEL